MVTRTGIDKIKERPPSSRRAASAHRALAFGRFDFLRIKHEKISPGFCGGDFFMVTRTGIEPMLPP